MSNIPPHQFRDANEYAEHVEHCLHCGTIPMPPSTAEELLVITDEHPHLAAEYLPPALTDTPFRRVLSDLAAEIPDWV